MKTIENQNSHALIEVWKWKEAVYKDTENHDLTQKEAYFQKGLELAAKILNARLQQNPDGSYSLL